MHIARVGNQRPQPTASSPFVNQTHSCALRPAVFIAICLGLVIVTAAAYAPVRHYGFVAWDDAQHVSTNPHVIGGLTWSGLRWAFTTEYFSNWHPLTWLSHMADAQVFGINGRAHHIVNVSLHIINTLLLFGLLRRMTGALGRSAFVAALFAVHPLHVESVAWVAERKDVLNTLFGLLAIWAYVASVQRKRLGMHVVALLLFACSLMAKPMLVTLPFVLLLLDYWPLERLRADSSASVWTALARRQVGYWSSDVALWQHAIDVAPQNYRAENNLGVALAVEGKLDQAIAHYRESIRLTPGFAETHNNLGAALANQGRYEEALAQYYEAIRLKPDYPDPYQNIQIALANQARITPALPAIPVQQRLATAATASETAQEHSRRAAALASQGKGNDALFEYMRAIRGNPNLPEAWRGLQDLMDKQQIQPGTR
ncbi:MAG: tetratricopeptide repeat protein [Acidobacteria bacterium]|nr:tetratricopeptide repeat protein [Acidobacteriota bacterium]